MKNLIRKIWESDEVIDYENVIDCMSPNVAVINSRGEICYANKKWKSFGLENGSLNLSKTAEGSNYFDVCEAAVSSGELGAREILDGIKAVFSGSRDQFVSEYFCDTPDGEKWFLVFVNPMGAPSDRVVVSHFNITDYKQKEIHLLQQTRDLYFAAKAASDAKSQFLATMSHEIRTPLAGVSGFTELLANLPEVSENQTKYADMILHNVRHLEDLIGDVLDWSKLESQKLEIKRQYFQVKSEIEKAVHTFQGLADSKQVQLQLIFEGEGPAEIHTDPMRLRQVIYNLVGNALKFTSRGSVVIKVSASLNMQEDSSLRLKILVVDTGVGIEPSKQKLIFDPFVQGDMTISRKFGGSGLGLALSRKIANLLGGEIHLLKSEPNEGSEFLFELPNLRYREGNGTQTTPLAKKATEPPVNYLSGLKILSVEDSEDIQVLLCTIFESYGAQLDCAFDGKEGVRKAMSQEYDLILMDVNMPVMDGLRAIKLLRRLGYDKPIISLTADPSIRQKSTCLNHGSNVCLIKPFKIDSFLEIAKSILKK